MTSINTGRWLAGGVTAGVLIWLLEGAASLLYMDDMRAALEAHGMTMEMSPTVFAISVFVSLIVGLALVFFYAAARPRFGPGPKTAVIVAVGLWLSGYVVSLCGFYMMGLFPNSVLGLWAVVGLVELVLAGLLGGWIYREAAA